MKYLLVSLCIIFSSSQICVAEVDIYDRAVKNPSVQPDVLCEYPDMEDGPELFSWELLARLNSPIFYDQPNKEFKHHFWGEVPSWQMAGANIAPYWSLMTHHNEVSKARPPFLRVNDDWQCDKNCLIEYPPTMVNSGENSKPNQTPLIDQFGNRILYEIRVNTPWLYSTRLFSDLFKSNQMQASYFNRGNCGSYSNVTGKSESFISTPSIMVKIAWKELTAEEDQSLYITQDIGGATLGVVGFHLSAKTSKYWEWIWSTFEHKNNFVSYEYKGNQVKSNFRGLDTDCKGNTMQCGTAIPEFKDTPSNVTKLNEYFVSALDSQGSPLQNYKMLGTQYVSLTYQNSDKIKSYEKDLEDCKVVAGQELRPPIYVSKDQRYTYEFKQASIGCKNPRAIILPTLYGPVFEPFQAAVKQDNLSCISCHVDADINDEQAKTIGSFKTYSDFSFTPSHYGIPTLGLKNDK